MIYAMIVLAFFTGEADLDGPNKLCIYSSAYGEAAIAIKDYEVCPVTIETEDL